ncbi:hypothetical protein JW930_06710 [Candidatus Woesearchaeota archaeon]|nr:hypothetical protein [Candidatus Woesearchaeota archaeon]
MGDKLNELIKLIDQSMECDPWMKKTGLKGYGKEIIGEANELLEAINNEDIAHIKEELADILREVIIISRFAKDEFNFDDIIAEIVEKINRRQPYVLEGKKVSIEQALEIWKQAKIKEKNEKKH